MPRRASSHPSLKAMFLDEVLASDDLRRTLLERLRAQQPVLRG